MIDEMSDENGDLYTREVEGTGTPPLRLRSGLSVARGGKGKFNLPFRCYVNLVVIVLFLYGGAVLEGIGTKKTGGEACVFIGKIQDNRCLPGGNWAGIFFMQ